MHLATDVTGALIESKSNIDVFTLLNQLHPSAAVCGTPTDKAAKIDPKNIWYVQELAYMYLEQGKHIEASVQVQLNKV